MSGYPRSKKKLLDHIIFIQLQAICLRYYTNLKTVWDLFLNAL